MASVTIALALQGGFGATVPTACAATQPAAGAPESFAFARSLPPDLGDDTLRHFDSAFTAISDKTHVAIVVEGVPLLQTLDSDQLGDLKRSLSGWANLNRKQVVSRIAAAYDYDSEEINSKTYILRKRYSDPNDLPFVTYAELTRDLKAVLEFLDPGATGRVTIGKDSVFWAFWDSLTPDQQKRGRQGIALSQLSSAQSTLALAAGREALLHGPTFMLRWVLNELQLLRDPRVDFRWLKMPEGEAFGFQGPFGITGQIGPFPLNNGFRTSGAGMYSHSVIEAPHTGPVAAPARSLIPDERFSGAQTGVRLPFDPGAPTNVDRFLAPGMFSGRLPGTLSLSELAATFTAAGPTKVRVSVDNDIGEKPICVYGSTNTDADHLLRAAGGAYGLIVREAGTGTYVVGLPRPNSIDQVDDAAREINRLMPSPVLRYYARQTDRISRIMRSNTSASVSGTRPNAVAANKEVADQLKSAALAQKAWYFPAVRRLLVLAQPAVPARTSPPVRADSLGPEVLRLMAFVLLSGEAMREVDKLGKFSTPHCLANPDDLVVLIQENYQRGLGQDVVSVTFGYNDSSGTFVNEGGSGGARKPTESLEFQAAADAAPKKPQDIPGGLPHPP